MSVEVATEIEGQHARLLVTARVLLQHNVRLLLFAQSPDVQEVVIFHLADLDGFLVEQVQRHQTQAVEVLDLDHDIDVLDVLLDGLLRVVDTRALENSSDLSIQI